MLFAFFGWGLVMPQVTQRGWPVDRLISLGVPLSLLLLFGAVALGPRAGAAWWAAWCIACTFVSLSQPAVAQAFPTAAAGRALSAFNLVIFLGVFCVQWGIGLVIDALLALGWPRLRAFQVAFGLFALGGSLSYAWFLLHGRGRAAQPG